ncbi:MAG: histidinol-phosphatase, partial [Solirubrobacteraceae bacterium]
MPERFAIAQVAPHPLEDAHEVGTFAGEVARELAERGHRVLLLAPSRSPDLVRESRRAIRAARDRPEAIFDPDGGVRVL